MCVCVCAKREKLREKFRKIYNRSIGIMVRVFGNGTGDRGSILSRVIPKTHKMILDASLLNTQYYKVWIKSKWSNPGKGIAPSPTPRCSSY